jgi:hypothetical protein
MEHGVRQHGAGDEATAARQLLSLLSGALMLVDELAYPPEIGARLQEVIDQVQNFGPPSSD